MMEQDQNNTTGSAVAKPAKTGQELADPITVDTSRAFKREDLERWHDTVDYSSDRGLKLAKLVILFVFGFGGIWACTAPLGGAVIATGRVVAENHNRVVQHLEGGILSEVVVREGQRVEVGQELARLDSSRVVPQLENAELQRAVLQVQLARRRAEIQGLDEITLPEFSPELLANKRLQETIESQTSEFYALNDLEHSQIKILDNKIEALKDDIEGQQAVIKAREKQDELLAMELRDFKDLLEKGLVQRTRVFATERELAAVRANTEISKLNIEKSRNDIVSTEAQKAQVRLERLKQAEGVSVELQKDINTLDAQIAQLQDVLERTVIRSPTAGFVFRIAKKTPGAVLRPGDALLEIVPELEDFRVEANVQIRDFEKVFIGQDVEMRLLSVTNRATPPVKGKITYLSSDSVMAEDKPEGYYIAYVSVNEGEDTASVVPGNMATVFIKTEPSTFLEILLNPLTRFSSRAFKG
ncbi:HlyD family type I secretion periplasmic adaptor subunit [Kordiimonas sp.]|uniref:HlyD family type I secretion periplasmic adaptor subunit n=1 Tax=Kordiimonas sp. TaxID=1970157 RepID=UPI003A94B436